MLKHLLTFLMCGVISPLALALGPGTPPPPVEGTFTHRFLGDSLPIIVQWTDIPSEHLNRTNPIGRVDIQYSDAKNNNILIGPDCSGGINSELIFKNNLISALNPEGIKFNAVAQAGPQTKISNLYHVTGGFQAFETDLSDEAIAATGPDNRVTIHLNVLPTGTIDERMLPAGEFVATYCIISMIK